MSLQRAFAIAEGRAMVRVQYIRSHENATIGVCPGCWNNKKRREILLIKLNKMGLMVMHKNDMLEGVYKPEKHHAPGCPFGKKENRSRD
ncbi:MAG: hypothetical protein JXJ04_13890 [Spirochaetales bacterium]|nr:hypothetical protein [Spirochaetales bacterium]